MEPQVFRFLARELEHEIVGETIQIPADGTIQRLSFDKIELREVPVEHDPFGEFVFAQILPMTQRGFSRPVGSSSSCSFTTMSGRPSPLKSATASAWSEP